MSAHVLLNLLKELRKEIKCEACRAFYHFFATSLINSTIQEQEIDSFYHMTLKNSVQILKSHFWHENVRGLPYIS